MKYLWGAVVLLICFQSWAITVPPKYNLKAQNGGVLTYKHKSEDIYAITVDVSKANVIFGSTLTYDSEDTYTKGRLKDHWDNNGSNQTAAIVNGQFFDRLGWPHKNYTSDPAKLVFPTKSNYSVVSNGVHDSLTTRSIIINSSGKVYFREGFSRAIFNNNNIKEYLTGLKPDTNKKPDKNIGRNYIGGIQTKGCNPSRSQCEYTHLIFFIAKNSNHYDMLSQLSQWGVHAKARLMMDGSASAQMIVENASNGAYTAITTSRKVPNAILIENK